MCGRGAPRSGIHHALIDHRSLAFYLLGGEAANDLVIRLHDDDGLRQRVAEVLGVTLEDIEASEG
jgi:hypothetical protein